MALVPVGTLASTTRPNPVKLLAAMLGSCIAMVALAASPAPAQPISEPRWLGRVAITEYFPVPEAWFRGRTVRAPGIPGRHRIDWLYSARGLTMEGDGLSLGRRRYHVAATGRGGWVNASGKGTRPRRRVAGWSRGAPYWRAGNFWRNRFGAVTFPLLGGGWSEQPGLKFVPLSGVSFAPGPSLPLRYYRSVAVDPRLIPLGSRIYIPAYKSINGGWFVAQDTGGAIIGRHLDVYRPAPGTPFGGGRHLTAQRVLVVPPAARAPSTGND